MVVHQAMASLCLPPRKLVLTRGERSPPPTHGEGTPLSYVKAWAQNLGVDPLLFEESRRLQDGRAQSSRASPPGTGYAATELSLPGS
jgi:hypothetical protein